VHRIDPMPGEKMLAEPRPVGPQIVGIGIEGDDEAVAREPADLADDQIVAAKPLGQDRRLGSRGQQVSYCNARQARSMRAQASRNSSFEVA
jgi:hypothetical protein